jgi:hypothetical protein
MDLTEALPLTFRATVEVSGWDERETLFVGKSELSSDDFANNYISLEHRLLEGAIVFIRALQATYIICPSPVPFEVELLGFMLSRHFSEFLNVRHCVSASYSFCLSLLRARGKIAVRRGHSETPAWFGTHFAFVLHVSITSHKTVKVSSLRSNLTPCIFDDDLTNGSHLRPWSLTWATRPSRPETQRKRCD